MSGLQKKQTQANTNKAKDAIAKVLENGATPQAALQKVAKQIASENGGTVSMGDKSLGNGMDYSVTNAEGQTGHFDLSSVSTVQDGYDLTAFKYDIGWQDSIAWDKKPFTSSILAEGSGPRFGVEIFGRSDKYLFPFEVSTGVGHQIGNEVNTYDAGALGRWLYWYTR